MARKLPVLQRVLGAPALFSVAYGEIASSIYFALGIIAGRALGLTPEVLLLTGLLFLVVALSYAEGITAIPETGGAATLVRKAFNDFAGFCTGWVLFLDYLIVIALSALFLPHYLGGALEIEALQEQPWDVVVGAVVIVGVGVVRLFRRPGLYSAGIGVAVLDLVTQLLVVFLGLALLFSPDALSRGVEIGSAPSWSELAFALPLAMLAYTGLETVANLAEEARRPGIDIPRSFLGAIGVVVAIYVAIAVVGLSAFPVSNGETELGGAWLFAPLLGIAEALGEDLSPFVADALRVFVGVSGALILLAAATTSVSGFGRLAYSLGEHGMLPRTFGRLGRRTLIAPASLVSVVVIAAGGLIVVTATVDDEVAFLAALFSFGVLLAFAAAQLAVIRLRFTAPELERPYRVPGNVRIGATDVPIPAVVGLLLTAAVWVAAMITHPGARYAGPIWLATGLVVYGLVRRHRGEGLLERVISPDEQAELAESAALSRILVPMKLGIIGEEMVATAVKLAQERGSDVEALHVVRVPLSRDLDAPADAMEEERAVESLEEARLLGEDHGVVVRGSTVHARSIGEAIVRQATSQDVDLIVLGSAPRWRRQSRFFSPTVEYVLQNAPCEVLVVAFPEHVIAEEAT
ncbi:MAG TPA: universal stress protein [Gaiellaceae bacterium]|nr:universal stress protein [Gaiellaceae bacterium]